MRRAAWGLALCLLAFPAGAEERWSAELERELMSPYCSGTP